MLKFFTLGFIRFITIRLIFDRILLQSAALSYFTLLSLVPLATVVFSALSIFPVFENIKQEVEDFIFSNFVPNSGEIIQSYLHEFVENASGMTLIGVLVLILVALLLISSIERALNEIWRTNKNRRLAVSFAVYWVALTLGPILIGTSILVTSYLTSYAELSTLTDLTGFSFKEIKVQLFEWFPFLASISAFLLLYQLVPHTSVKWQHSLSGAVVAAILFEFSKLAFAFYMTHFPLYQTIYGALAAIPILFVWVYVSWSVVLVGAEIAASMDAFEKEHSSETLVDDSSVQTDQTAVEND